MGTTSGKKRLWQLNTLVAVLVAVIAVLLGSMLVGKGGGSRDQQTAQQEQAGSQQPSPLDSLARRKSGDPMAIGRVDAPVVMIAYEDFRCPFCAKFSTDIAPELKKRYVDSGVLRIEWRDFPVFGPQSVQAAKAGRAAARQGKFWQFKDVVFSHAPERGHPELSMPTLIDYAKQAGIPDIERFKADMNDPAVDRAIRADTTEGESIGVSATPTFIVNGDPIMGAQPLPTFVSAIEQARAAAR